MADSQQRFSAQELVDNEYYEFVFPEPVTVTANQPLTVKIYSDDVDENNMVALWCTQTIPARVPLFPAINLPKVDNPQVTIVLPVFNQAEHSLNCLLSIAACDPEITKQVIIINNGSADVTADLLASLPDGVDIIQNPDNYGFLVACRQAGGLVQGEYMLLLHQHTQLLSGCLQHLIEMASSDAMVGAVGSKILYPDGHLFSAGGIVFNNGSYCHYGHMQDPTLPTFSQSRETDYCPDVSLLIKTGLWHHLGGFDERYVPMGYQDVDLCFGLRQAGYAVMYCPQSQVVYDAESDVTISPEQAQMSRAHFVAKWDTMLDEQQVSAETPIDEAAERLNQRAYEQRREQEISRYAEVENVHDLPDIFHYWSNKYLLPMQQTLGFNNANAFFCQYMQQVCEQFPDQICRFVSIGAGNCDLEVTVVEMLRQEGVNNF